MSVRIITDSASDISPEEGKELGVSVVPLKMIIEGQEYLDLSLIHIYYKKESYI